MRCGLVFLSLAVALAVAEQKTLVSHSNSTNDNTHLGIYHGKKTTIKKHPYLVGLITFGEFNCAGTIISESWILTTGDCAYGLETTDITVVSGSSDGSKGKTYTVKKIVVHPNYGQSQLDYEFACIQIDGKFKWSPTTKAIKISKKTPKKNSIMTVAGYGSTDSFDETDELSEDGVGSGTLLEGTMNWLDLKVCEKDFADFGLTWSNRMGCAYNKGKTTLCTGDWADAFVRKNVMYGMFVAGATTGFCSGDAMPVILADVAPVAKWIKKTTGAKLDDEPDDLSVTL